MCLWHVGGLFWSVGRFDLNLPSVMCLSCTKTWSPDLKDIIKGGYWPGTVGFQTVFHPDVFRSFEEAKLIAPGLSRQAFVKLLEHRSVQFGRVSTILYTHCPPKHLLHTLLMMSCSARWFLIVFFFREAQYVVTHSREVFSSGSTVSMPSRNCALRTPSTVQLASHPCWLYPWMETASCTALCGIKGNYYTLEVLCSCIAGI